MDSNVLLLKSSSFKIKDVRKLKRCTKVYSNKLSRIIWLCPNDEEALKTRTSVKGAVCYTVDELAIVATSSMSIEDSRVLNEVKDALRGTLIDRITENKSSIDR